MFFVICFFKRKIWDIIKPIILFNKTSINLTHIIKFSILILNKLIANNQDKDAQLDDLRKENAINAKRIDLLSKMMNKLILLLHLFRNTSIKINDGNFPL